MAGTPHRATAVENALINRPWTVETVTAAADRFAEDYTPMTDMRASAGYRLQTAQNLLHRYLAEMSGEATSVLEVTS